ncbi:energy-coupling factor transporter transmembrane protein EcfT [Candidatus Vagococcus giribetii]|uniref:energy-coupling factor transporter transmembrane protein EcfT n=1 Tax=Candidatus Vagococcus giribetii TaxID=2230876 RepID=UPI001F5E1442|nr:energy-coupling factor transporter transmembrane protein EcfT [Vagococcus sp. DIV0080]
MNIVKTNSLNLTCLLFFFTLEISFTKSIALNLFIVGLSVIFLMVKKRYFGLAGLFLLPLIPAISTFWSVMVYGSGSDDAWLLFSRTFAFAALGMMFAFGIDLEELLLVLEQKKVSPNFIYGILVVLHAIPDIKQEIRELKNASLLRGKRMTVFSPYLYLKTIFVAFNWRDQYTEAMISRGFDDDGKRMPSITFQTPVMWILISTSLIVIGNSLMILTF